MNAKLTPEIQEALSANPGQPIPIEDAESQKMYVLIERDEYLQLNSLQNEGDRDQLSRLIGDGMDSGPSVPADDVFADLRRRAAQLSERE